MAPLRRAGAGESEAGSHVMNHFLNTGAEGINHREEGFEKSRGSVPATPLLRHPAPEYQKQTSTLKMTCQAREAAESCIITICESCNLKKTVLLLRVAQVKKLVNRKLFLLTTLQTPEVTSVY